MRRRPGDQERCKKAARPGGKALTLRRSVTGSGEERTVAGVRHIETAEEAVRQFVGNLEVVYQAAKKRKGFIAGPDSGTTGRTTAVALADKLDMHPDGGAAKAALSPNMDWNYNLAQSRRPRRVLVDGPGRGRRSAKAGSGSSVTCGSRTTSTTLPGDPMKPESKWIAGRRSRGDTSPVRDRRPADVPSTPGRGRRCTRRGVVRPELRVNSGGRWCLLVPSRGTGGSQQATSPRPRRSRTTRPGQRRSPARRRAQGPIPTTTSLTPTTTADRAAMSPSTRTQPPPCSGHLRQHD